MLWKTIVIIAGLLAANCFAQAPVHLKVVKGSPFSAQAVTQSTQELADGNRIIHQTTAFLARDSEGRTRREESSVVFIQDPVVEAYYVLEPKSRSARKREVANSQTGDPAETANSEGANLGQEFIDGVLVTGTRDTRTIPAQSAGNEKPLQVVLETWYSPELQIVVMRHFTDPRQGETTYRVTNIQRGEPSTTLFQVPTDYNVTDESGLPGRSNIRAETSASPR
jgi:hypothetical protein